MLMLLCGMERHCLHCWPRALKYWTLVALTILPGICALADSSEIDESIDAVTLKDKQVYCIRGNQTEAATNAVKLPFEVIINPDGKFTVAAGAERELQEGQIIRKDGWLLDPTGGLSPVFDHVTLVEGTVVVVRDGNPEELTQTRTFSNGLTIAPDGSVLYPSGARSRLADGQLFRLDGTTVASKDTANIVNGQVVMLKSATLIALTSPPMWGMLKIMGMNDGTKVRCDGLITRWDGTTFWLTEGQTILIDGPAARR